MRTVSTIFLFLVPPIVAQAQTSFPMITHTTPVAVQRGQTTEILVQGKMNFVDAYRVLFEGEGISAEIVPQKLSKAQKARPLTRVKLKVQVEADAALGVREFRLASKLGISSIGQLVVVDYPVVPEISANNSREQAQDVKLPCVLAGRLEAKEDVDYFKFVAKKGDFLTFEVLCARLQDKIHDLQSHAKPMIVLLDDEGRELAANDSFYFADPMMSYQAPKDGTYFLQIRESTYDGDPRWVYAVLATNRPYASHVYPLSGNPGEVVEVEPVGSARHFEERVSLTLPKEAGIHRVSLKVGEHSTNPVTVVVNDLPRVLEAEPNDDLKQATKIAIPAAVNGRIGKMRDLDYYQFKAVKGKAIQFEVKARRFGTDLNSSVHAVLEVINLKGRILVRNLDTHGNEPKLVFTPTADGDYLLRVRDLNSKGSESAIYLVEADWARPDFSIQCDPDKAMIGPGSSTAWFIKLERENGFKGPVEVEVRNLPEGVTASPLTIQESMKEGVIVVSAKEDAKISAGHVEIVGTGKVKDASGKEITLTRKVQSIQEIYSPGGGRAQFPVNLQTVAVTRPSDILKVEIKPNRIELIPGKEVKVEVTVKRNPDYKKNISLDILLRHLNRVYGNPLPNGVTVVAGKSKTLLGKGDKGHIVLKAAANATPIENIPVAVLTHVSINFVVKVSYASEPLWISVKKK